MRESPYAQHCLALLSYVSKHREDFQTVYGLAEQCGIPRRTLREILAEAKEQKYNSLLYHVARNYGYEFIVLEKTQGRVIDVEARGPYPIRR